MKKLTAIFATGLVGGLGLGLGIGLGLAGAGALSAAPAFAQADDSTLNAGVNTNAAVTYYVTQDQLTQALNDLRAWVTAQLQSSGSGGLTCGGYRDLPQPANFYGSPDYADRRNAENLQDFLESMAPAYKQQGWQVTGIYTWQPNVIGGGYAQERTEAVFCRGA
jgi:hypothetical protein